MSPLRLALVSGLVALAAACAHAPAQPAGPQLPQVTLPRYPDGAPVSFAADRGKIVVIDVWATWCVPCKESLPEWEALARSYAGREVRFYAMSVDGDPNKVSEFINETKLSLPVVLDRDAAVAEGVLKLRYVPTAFIVDRQGVIRATHEAYSAAEVKGFAKEIDPLLNEK